MHADNGGIEHLDSGIRGTGKCVDDAASDTSPPPHKSVVAGSVRTRVRPEGSLKWSCTKTDAICGRPA